MPLATAHIRESCGEVTVRRKTNTVKKSRTPWLWLAGAVPVGLWGAMSFVAWMNGDYTGASLRLGSEIAAARKEGLAVDASDLRLGPPVADADNAAPLLI